MYKQAEHRNDLQPALPEMRQLLVSGSITVSQGGGVVRTKEALFEQYQTPELAVELF